MSEPARVIERGLRPHLERNQGYRRCHCGAEYFSQRVGYPEHVAASVLDALTAAGYAIVTASASESPARGLEPTPQHDDKADR